MSFTSSRCVSCLAVVCAAIGMAFALGASTVRAQTPTPPPISESRSVIRGDKFVVGDNFILRSSDTLQGSLIVLGGNASLEEGSRVEGDLTVVGGNVDVFGAVGGDLSVLGGNARLRSSARVEGDELVFGGTVVKDAGAVVRGRTTRAPGAVPTPAPPRVVPPVPPAPTGPFAALRNFRPNIDFSPLGSIAGIALITVFAAVAVALFPANTARALEAAQGQALLSGAMGAVAWVGVPAALVAMAVTICLIPFALILGVAWALAVLFGWSVIARFVGEKLMIGFGRRDWTLIGQTAAGAVLLAILGAVPLVGGVIGFVASSVGVGALALSRFGTRSQVALGYPV